MLLFFLLLLYIIGGIATYSVLSWIEPPLHWLIAGCLFWPITWLLLWADEYLF